MATCMICKKEVYEYFRRVFDGSVFCGPCMYHICIGEPYPSGSLTQRAADAPKAAAICTCSMDDGIHEWNCALNTARR
jgi:hypothetical protein